MSPPLIVGIVGGIASGKSEVTRQLESLGAAVVYADRIGHEVLTETDVIAKLRQRFGGHIWDAATQRIERSRLAADVFGDGHEKNENRRYLEELLHPRIRSRLDRRIQELEKESHPPMVVIDAPLLIESGWVRDCDRVLFVDTPESARRDRAMARGWSQSEFQDREAAQIGLSEKLAAATDVLNNDGTLEALQAQVDAWWRRTLSDSVNAIERRDRQ